MTERFDCGDVKFIVMEKCLRTEAIYPIAVFDTGLDAQQYVDRLIDETPEEYYGYKVVDVRYAPTDLWH